MQTIEKERLIKAILRQDLSSYIKKVFKTVSPNTAYMHNWHIDLIAEYLQACQNREIKRLIINIPPRYMKSIAVNVAWTSYILGVNPSERIISSSYSLNLSRKHSIDTRLVMESGWYRELFPNTILGEDQNTQGKFITTKRGHRIATAVGSSLTGEGGNFLICDDPINAVNASSELISTRAVEWFDQAFTTRLDDKQNGVIVVIMQRLSESDLTGHLMEKGGYELLKIPAIAGSNITYSYPISGRIKLYKKGEVLHASRENSETIQATKRAIGSAAFAGQYLQEPAPIGGNIIKKEWIQYVDTYPQNAVIYQTWDTANKDGEENDYSACITWAVNGNQFYVINVWKDKLQFPELRKAMIVLAERYKPRQIIIEDKASGQQLLQVLRRETSLPVTAYNPKGFSKVERMAIAAIEVEAKRVYIKNSSLWCEEFIHDITTFPSGRYKDTCDAFSMFINWHKERPSFFIGSI